VETSNIHLLVAAEPGPGNLLGNLLCGLVGLLDPIDLGDILAGLLPEDQLALLEQIRDLLNAALEQITATENIVGVSGTGNGNGNGDVQPAHPGQGKQLGVGKGKGRGQGVGGGRATAPGQVKKGDPGNGDPGNGDPGNGDPVNGEGCDILNLELAPITLDLLGLIVHLDNCQNGPITVDITAHPGPGALLGNLLCALAGLLDAGLTLDDIAVQELADLIAQEILNLLDLGI
jgi:hypothetical protein